MPYSTHFAFYICKQLIFSLFTTIYIYVDSSEEWSDVEDSVEDITSPWDIHSDQDTAIDSHGDLGFKIVGDNLDKTIRPRFQTTEWQTRTLHYFHTYAVRDRIPSAHLSDTPPALPMHVDIAKILPSESTHRTLAITFTTLVSR